jgi:hypothetical protein
VEPIQSAEVNPSALRFLKRGSVFHYRNGMQKDQPIPVSALPSARVGFYAKRDTLGAVSLATF